jgi:hypothetical protein
VHHDFLPKFKQYTIKFKKVVQEKKYRSEENFLKNEA